MRPRLYKVLKKYSIIFGVGLAYLIWVLITDLRIPCPLSALSGIKCPGCGVTRMIAAIARLDLASAFGYNPFLFVTGPVILLLVFLPEYRYVRYARYDMRWERYIALPLVFAAIIFGILRNF